MIRPLYYVWCDGDDCSNWNDNRPADTKEAAWRIAKIAGWGSCSGKRHLCPACLGKRRATSGSEKREPE